MVERLLNRWHAMAHRHVDGRADRHMAAAVLDQSPRRVVDAKAMDVFVARPQQPGASKLDEGSAEVVADEVLHDRHADFACEREYVGIEVGRQSKRQQLILGAEIRSLQPFDVLWILRGGAG